MHDITIEYDAISPLSWIVYYYRRRYCKIYWFYHCRVSWVTAPR